MLAFFWPCAVRMCMGRVRRVRRQDPISGRCRAAGACWLARAQAVQSQPGPRASGNLQRLERLLAVVRLALVATLHRVLAALARILEAQGGLFALVIVCRVLLVVACGGDEVGEKVQHPGSCTYEAAVLRLASAPRTSLASLSG